MKALMVLAVCLVCGLLPALDTAPEVKPAVVQVPAKAEDQAQINVAWKDIQIAQMELQLAVQQALGGMEKGTYYDTTQRAFFRPAPVAAQKPAPKGK